MKKLFYSTVLAVFLLTAQNTQAQAWEKGTKVLGIGIGGSSFFHIDNGNLMPQQITGQLNFQGEFGVHDYVGVGFTTGIGGRGPYSGGLGYYGYYGYYGGYYYYASKGEVNVPVGVLANFHFYQLIADKTGKDIHADKLDVYAGLNVGSGVAAVFYANETRIVPLAFGGVQVGARYYFTDKFGVNLEVGYPKIVHGGIVFKL